MPELLKYKITNLAPYLYISLGLLVVFFILGRLNPQRIGDGGEYYALYYAWDTSFRPWMTTIAYNAYEELYASHKINGLISREWLENVFPALKMGTTADLNHFWFYSFLAFLCTKILSLIGVNLQIHESFLVLHYILLVVVTSISYRYYKWNGVFVVLLMTFISPMLWFLDKVHTELFTYCLVLSSIILICAKKYLPAALFLALASTQNPSFALIACIPVIYRVVLQRNEAYSIVDVAVFVATALAVLAHPIYYFARFGVITPQLLAGGASLGGNLSIFYIWIIDPDLGLLPNWPLGLAALVLALGIWFFRRDRQPANIDLRWSVFLILYIVINLFAQSSTINLNTGATPGLARYALWYIPLAFPIIYRISVSFTWRRTGFYFLAPAILFVSVLSVNSNDPRRPEQYDTPSVTSFFIQSKLPWLYSPPQEIFLERYSGFGEVVYSQNIRGVIGPDCQKLLLLPGDNRKGVTSPNNCFFDPVKLDLYARSLISKINGIKYVSLNKLEELNLSLEVSPGIYKVGSGANGNFILGEGWRTPEKWGVWSKDKVATLTIPCNSKQFFASSDTFSLSIKIQPFGKQSLKIFGRRGILWHGDIDDGQINYIHFNVSSQNCKNGLSGLSMNISNPISPLELGQSTDGRKLGVGLMEFQIKIQ